MVDDREFPCASMSLYTHTHTHTFFPSLSRLGLHLPHKVANRETKAKWISDKETLEVIMKLEREFDFANF